MICVSGPNRLGQMGVIHNGNLFPFETIGKEGCLDPSQAQRRQALAGGA